MAKQSSKSHSLRSTLRRWQRIVATLLPFGRKHWRWFARGSAAALVVIAARLALPWPLKAVLKPWLKGEHHHNNKSAAMELPGWIPSNIDPVLVLGGLFLLLLLLLGLADMLARLYYARFSIATARDLRAAAFRAAMQSHPEDRSKSPGDMISRLVSDMARMKGGLKSFLVHVATNGAMFAGVTAVLLWMDWRLGLVFACAGAITAMVMFASARSIFDNSRTYRKKEGKRAHKMHLALLAGPQDISYAKVKSAKTKHNANVTRLQGLATWCTHGVFGVAVVVAFWLGMRGVDAGRLQVDHMVVFIMYALMMRGPIVRLTRQGARTGKILAGADRLVSLMQQVKEDSGPATRSGQIIAPLQDRIRLTNVLVKGAKSHGMRPRLGPIDLDLRVGERIALLADPGSGKTSLLDVVAGRRVPQKGVIYWDEIYYDQIATWDLSQQIAVASQQPAFLRRRVRELLHLPDPAAEPPDADDVTTEFLTRCGVDDILARLPAGLDTKLGSDDLSPNETHLLNLVRTLRHPRHASVRLYDDPFAGLSDEAAAVMIDALLISPRQETVPLVVVSMTRPVAINRFDRVVELSSGLVVFDGTSQQWLATRTTVHESQVGSQGHEFKSGDRTGSKNNRSEIR